MRCRPALCLHPIKSPDSKNTCAQPASVFPKPNRDKKHHSHHLIRPSLPRSDSPPSVPGKKPYIFAGPLRQITIDCRVAVFSFEIFPEQQILYSLLDQRNVRLEAPRELRNNLGGQRRVAELFALSVWSCQHLHVSPANGGGATHHSLHDPDDRRIHDVGPALFVLLFCLLALLVSLDS